MPEWIDLLAPGPACGDILGDSGTSVWRGLEHRHAWRDYGSRVWGTGGSSAWGSGPLTAALLMMHKAQALLEWPQSQGPECRYSWSNSGSKIGILAKPL